MSKLMTLSGDLIFDKCYELVSLHGLSKLMHITGKIKFDKHKDITSLNELLDIVKGEKDEKQNSSCYK